MKFSSLIGIFCVVAFSVVHVSMMDLNYDYRGARTNNSNYPDDYDYDEVQEMEFKLIGKELFLPYEAFKGLPPGTCTNLTTLHLEYLEFDHNELVQSLEGCDELKSIKLNRIEFLNPVTRKVALPGLESFYLNMPIQANTAGELLDHLFFFKNETVPVTVKNIKLSSSGKDDMLLTYWSGSGSQVLSVRNMKYDPTKYFNYRTLYVANSFVDHQSIKVNNLTSFHLYSSADYEDGLFETLKLAYSLTQLALRGQDVNIPRRSIDFSIFPSIENFTNLNIDNVEIWSSKSIHLRELLTLELNDCEFNTTLISVSNSVIRLVFRRVRFINDDLNSFLSPMNKLQSIELNYAEIPGQKIDLTSLGNSSDVLEYHLWFYGMQIQISSRLFQFLKIKYLYFSECAFDENVLPFSWFNSTFPKIEHVVLHQNNMSYSMFQEILNSSVSKVDIKPSKFEIPEITKFLQDSGIPSGVSGTRLEKSENSTTGWWITNSNKSSLPNTGLRNIVLYAYILLLMAVCGFGLFGSLVSSSVLTRKNMWGSTSCILLGLTFFDSVVLSTYICSVLYFGIKLILGFLELRVPVDQVYQILGFQVTQLSIKRLDDLQYSILYPLNKTAYTGSVYTTVLLTIERYVAVCWPLHARQFLRTRVAVTSILLVLGFSIILNFPRWIEAQQYDSEIDFGAYDYYARYLDGRTLGFDRTTHAYGLLRYRYYRQYYHVWIWVTFMYLIPISGLTILNILILKQLRKSNQNRKALAATNQRNNAVNQEEVQLASLTKMLLCVIMIFVLCNSVSGVIVWVFIARRWDPMDVEIFSCIPLIINSSINFVIYVLLGSKFRTELLNLISNWRNVICSCWHWSRRSDTENNVRPTPLVQLPGRPQELS